MRGETLIFVCSYRCVVGPASVGGPAWRRPLPPFSLYKPVLTDPLHIRKNTQKSKFLLSQAFKWKKIMFFVIPEMPSKTIVMLYKKLPDHFKIWLLMLPYKTENRIFYPDPFNHVVLQIQFRFFFHCRIWIILRGRIRNIHDIHGFNSDHVTK